MVTAQRKLRTEFRLQTGSPSPPLWTSSLARINRARTAWSCDADRERMTLGRRDRRSV
jgi:hypothetical protein